MAITEQKDTRAAAEGDEKESAKFWHDELSAADKREETWRKRGKKVVDRYRDERDHDESSERRTNILWSNTETLKSVLFQGVAAPDVRRRFPKKGKDDRIARTAALVLENGLSYCADAYDSEFQVECAIEDMLLPGRGQAWIVYDADVEYGEKTDEESEAEAVDVVNQSVRFEHIYWEHYRTSAGRKETDVWWKARLHQYSRDELRKYFPGDAEKVPLDATVLDRPSQGKEDDDTFKRANVWEIWDKTKRERVYVAEGYPTILKKDEDPYLLRDFFPCPAPIYGCKTTSSLVPIPEYTLYQDQAEELDQITTRLNRLIDALKRRGVYDASAEGADNQLSQLAFAGDNEFIPYRGFAALMEKGGLAGVFQSEDLRPTIAVVAELYKKRVELVQTIYEVTGISDVIRGSSNPNETATAQRIKGQFGSLRIQKRQRAIQRFIRDLYRIKGEILAEHFTREKLEEMSGVPLPLQMEVVQAKQALAQIEAAQKMAAQPPQPGMPPQQMPQAPPPMPDKEQMAELVETAKTPSWEEVSEVLKSDEKRGYKIDVETDDTSQVDEQEEKSSRMEFLATMEGLLEKALPMGMQVPALVPLIRELSMFAVKAFKVGRTLEESFEETFTALQAQAEQAAKAGPPQDPKVMAEAERLKLDQQKMQMDAQAKQAEMALRQKEVEHSLGLEQQKAQTQAQTERMKLEHQITLETKRLGVELDLKRLDAAQKQAEIEHEQNRFQAETMIAAHRLKSEMDLKRWGARQEASLGRMKAKGKANGSGASVN